MLTFGSDPEFFATTLNDQGDVFAEPPIWFIKNHGLDADTSNKKHPIFARKNGTTLMGDGAAFELTIPPSTSPKEMYTNINDGINLLFDLISPLNYDVCVYPTVNFDIRKFKEINDKEIKEAVIFGCDPDMDAIDPEYNCEIINALEHPFRYGGGHFHIGSDKNSEIKLMHKYFLPLIRLLAVYVGNLVIGYTKFPDLEKLRAFHYGQPGRYRLQNWGVEYRTPSNSWITDLDLIKEMFRVVEIAFQKFLNPDEGKDILLEYLPETVRAITSADLDLSREILNKLGVM